MRIVRTKLPSGKPSVIFSTILHAHFVSCFPKDTRSLMLPNGVGDGYTAERRIHE